MSNNNRFALEKMSMNELASDLQARRKGEQPLLPGFMLVDVVAQLVHTMNEKFSVYANPFEAAELYLSDTGLVADDNRRDWWQLTRLQEKIAMGSSVAIMNAAELRFLETKRWRLMPHEFMYICASERFADQFGILSACSGVLVEGQFVISAQHCFSQQLLAGTLKETVRFVFGYWRSGDNQAAWDFTENDIYSAESFKFGDYDQSKDEKMNNDWIVFKLDRKVAGYPSAVMRPAGFPTVGDALYSVGYQHGMSAKYCDEAKIREMHLPTARTPQPHFVSDLDQMNQCSGAPVFSVANDWLEGITLRGAARDYHPPVVAGGCRLPIYLTARLAQETAVCIDTIRPVIKSW